MRIVHYLAYGSNLYPQRLRQRIADVRIIKTVSLPGWALRFHKIGRDGSGKCDLVRDAAGLAYGAVYAISTENKLRLDRIEGLGRGYEDERLFLDGVGETWFYRAALDHIDDSLKPYDWYKALVLAGLEYHGIPADYIRRVAAVPAAADPDPERARMNRALLAKS